MLEEAEHLELPEDTFGRHESLEDVGHFLERHPFAVSGICDGPETSEQNIGLLLMRRDSNSDTHEHNSPGTRQTRRS